MNTISLGSPVSSAIVAMLIVLLVGDFASTFLYHVPQHVWGKLHLRTHHDRRRSYLGPCGASRDPAVLLDGPLSGALPYIALALACAGSPLTGRSPASSWARSTSGGAHHRAGLAYPGSAAPASSKSFSPRTTTVITGTLRSSSATSSGLRRPGALRSRRCARLDAEGQAAQRCRPPSRRDEAGAR